MPTSRGSGHCGPADAQPGPSSAAEFGSEPFHSLGPVPSLLGGHHDGNHGGHGSTSHAGFTGCGSQGWWSHSGQQGQLAVWARPPSWGSGMALWLPLLPTRAQAGQPWGALSSTQDLAPGSGWAFPAKQAFPRVPEAAAPLGLIPILHEHPYSQLTPLCSAPVSESGLVPGGLCDLGSCVPPHLTSPQSHSPVHTCTLCCSPCPVQGKRPSSGSFPDPCLWPPRPLSDCSERAHPIYTHGSPPHGPAASSPRARCPAQDAAQSRPQ